MPSHYLVVDLEATCWKDARHPDREEVIEIGAVLVHSSARIVDEFQSFVKPLKQPTLTPFCIRLTTITQPQVDAAPPFLPAFSAFTYWAMTKSGGPWRGSTIGDVIAFCSWSKWDFDMLRRACDMYGIDFQFRQHVNLPAIGKQHAGCIAQRRLMKHLGLSFEGTRHRGIDDARNYANIVVEMLKRGWLTSSL